MINVILITIDTLRADMLGAYGCGDNLTPFIDSLQDNMVVFSNPYATGPYTQASFQGILASEYYLEYGKEKKLNAKKTLVSEPLKANGVYTAGFHSNAYLSYFFGYNKGWEIFYDSMQDDVTDMYPFIRGNEINNKVKGLARFHDDIMDVNVVLSYRNQKDSVKNAELILQVPGKTLKVNEESEDFSKSVDIAINKMERQLNDLRLNR